MSLTKTVFELDREYTNMKEAVDYLIWADDYPPFTYKMPLTNPMKALFQFKDIKYLKKDPETRVSESKQIEICNNIVYQSKESPMLYYFVGNSQKENGRKYLRIKKQLESEGYTVKFKDCKQEIDCEDMTCYQTKFNK